MSLVAPLRLPTVVPKSGWRHVHMRDSQMCQLPGRRPARPNAAVCWVFFDGPTVEALGLAGGQRTYEPATCTACRRMTLIVLRVPASAYPESPVGPARRGHLSPRVARRAALRAIRCRDFGARAIARPSNRQRASFQNLMSPSSFIAARCLPTALGSASRQGCLFPRHLHVVWGPMITDCPRPAACSSVRSSGSGRKKPTLSALAPQRRGVRPGPRRKTCRSR